MYQANITKKPFSKVKKYSQLLELIHSDICEVNDMLTRGGKRYFTIFIDDYSCFTYVYLLRTKENPLENSKNSRKW